MSLDEKKGKMYILVNEIENVQNIQDNYEVMTLSKILKFT